ncbi:MAG TPA: TMEM175 family protein [Nitrososphaeraceae archaeon]|nr:TMEM175 family protein [Nitrososphaeraceae archaeon]
MSGEVGNDISKSRIETLTDGVFAIVMTLLVLEIAVPQLSHSEAAIELSKQLLELWPVILSYGTSFIILGFFLDCPRLISSTTLNEQIEPFSG